MTGIKQNSSQGFGVMVLQTIADAMHHGIPLPQALDLLRGKLGHGQLKGVFFVPRTRLCLGLVIRELEEGQPLSLALNRHMPHLYPSWIREMIEQAEQNGRLEAIVPDLAKERADWHRRNRALRQLAIYPLSQTLAILIIMQGLLIFIYPKLMSMMSEVGVDRGWMPIISPATGLTVVHLLLTSVFLILVCFFGIRFFTWNRQIKGMATAERLLTRIPFLGRFVRLERHCRIVRRIGLNLQAGRTLPETLQATKASVNGPLADTLGGLLEVVEQGGNWLEAWEQLELCPPLGKWLVRSAAWRGDPEAGFLLAAESLQNDINRRQRRLARWLEPMGICLNAILAGTMVFTTMNMIIKMSLYSAGSL